MKKENNIPLREKIKPYHLFDEVDVKEAVRQVIEDIEERDFTRVIKIGTSTQIIDMIKVILENRFGFEDKNEN